MHGKTSDPKIVLYKNAIIWIQENDTDPCGFGSATMTDTLTREKIIKKEVKLGSRKEEIGE